MLPGQRVGRYEIRGEIGRGAMGTVHRAYDPKLGREVAIKTIAAAVAAGGDREEIAARFEREARVAARLQHPNVVAVYDAGHEGDTLYLVMELVAGETLGHRLVFGDFPSTAEALDIAAQAADALACAHEAGIIHRDVKPGNLLIGAGGRVKVSDFGVAKAIGEQTDLTRTGMMVGSPAYMAPEQVKGMLLDGRSDLFSLGVVLFEMIFRRKPFPADTVTTLVYQILHEDPLSDPALAGSQAPELAEFLRWALAKDRESRVPDARTFATRARALAAKVAVVPAETAPTTRLVRGTSSAPAPAPYARGAPAPPPPVVADRVPRAGSRAALWVGLAGLAAVIVVAAALLDRSPAPPEVGRPQEASTLVALPLPQPPAPEPAPAPREEPKEEPQPAAVAPAVTSAPAAPAIGTLPVTGTAPAAATSPAAAPSPAPAAAAPEISAVPASAPSPAPEPATETAIATLAPEPEPAPAPSVAVSSVFRTRRAAEFHVDPEDVLVKVDGRPIGTADDWDGVGGGEEFVFPGPGEYLVELSLAGFHTAWVKIVVSPDAKESVVDVDTELAEIGD